MDDVKNLLINVADDFQNNYLTPSLYAEHHQLTQGQCERLLKLAQDVRADYIEFNKKGY